MPKSKLGLWSVGLLLTFLVCLLTGLFIIRSGQRGGETFFSNLNITIPMLIAALAGVAAFVTGLLGIIRSRERSAIVFIATIVGLLVLLFVSGEVFSPH